MKFFADRSNPRRRDYIAPCRLVAVSPGVVGAEVLLAGEFQNCFDRELTVIPPGCEVVLDYGRELAGGIRIVTAPNDCRVSRLEITFGESVSEAIGTPDNEHAIHQTTLDLPPGGATEYGNTGFRFVRLRVPADAAHPLELSGAVAVSLMRDLEYAGRFESSDERLNAVWRTGARTVHLCMQDYIYDGIKRDRMVWVGDLYPEIRTILAVFDRVETVGETLEFVAATTPEGKWMNGIGSYSAWWVICLYAWYWRRGDLKFLKRQQRELTRIVGMLGRCVAADGREILDGMRFLDWPSSGDEAALHAGLQGLLGWSFTCAAKLAAWLGDDALCNECRKLLALVGNHRPAVPANKSAASLLALGGLATPEEALRRSLGVEPLRNLSTFFGFYVLEARARAGDLGGALEVIRRYWGAMLDYGATSFWEDFDLGWIANAGRIDEVPEAGKTDLHRDCGNYCYKGLRHSLCHGWAGGPTAFLSEHVLGIRPAAPGFREVSIAPQLAGLEHLSGAVPTPYGPIEVTVAGGRVDCKIPDGITLAREVAAVR